MSTSTIPGQPIDQRPAQPGATSQNDVTGQAPKDDDTALDSIGKAITDPVKTAADDEEPGPDGLPRVTPGG